MKKSVLLITAFFVVASTVGCSFGLDQIFGRPDDVDKRSSTLKNLNEYEIPASPMPDSFNILVFADTHFGKSDRTSYESKLIEWVNDNSLDPDKSPLFCFCLGDVADHGQAEEYKLYKDFCDEMKTETGVQIYTTVGNHDLYNTGWSNYVRYVYPYSSFYKFENNYFSFYSMDTASGCVGRAQYRALKEDFSHDQKRKIVFTHFPLYGEGDLYFRLQDMTERNMMISLFAENNVAACVSGHTHKDLSTDYKAFYDLNYYALCKSGKFLLLHVDHDKLTWEEISL